MIFVSRNGSLHKPSPTASEAAGLRTSCRILRIGPLVHRGVLHIHRRSPTSVILVSNNVWLVLAAGRPTLLGTTGQENNFYLHYLKIIHKQSTPIGLFESSFLHKPSMPIVLFKYPFRSPLSQNTANFDQ